MGENETTDNNVQSNDETVDDVDALYDSIMGPGEETEEPSNESQGLEDEGDKHSDVKPNQGNTELEKFILKHKDFENGERTFERDKVIDYAQKGLDYELKMHRMKSERQAIEQQAKNLENERSSFSKQREYWDNVDRYMKENPAFAETVRREYAKVQQDTAYRPLSPETQALQEKIEALQARLDEKDNEHLETSQKHAEESFVKSTADYKRNNSDFDWETKDEFGLTLQERIENHAVENEFKSFKDAANAYLFDQHLKRAALKAKEDAAKEFQRQKKLGLGPITDRSQNSVQQARNLSQMSYQDLVSESLEEFGIND